MSTPTSDALRAASDAMNTLEAAEDYLANPPENGRYGITLEWSWGRDHKDAYYAIKEEVTRLVNEQMTTMIQKAVQEIRAVAKSKRETAAHYLKYGDAKQQ